MTEIHIVVGLSAKPGAEDQLRKDLVALVAPSRREDGNLRYDLFEDVSKPGQFVFVEHWANAEAQQKHHTGGPHIQHFHDHGDENVASRDFVHILRKLA